MIYKSSMIAWIDGFLFMLFMLFMLYVIYVLILVRAVEPYISHHNEHFYWSHN
jgi:uncharacterized membrane protein YcgQ (UPF0703/DUF1980 family)